MASCTRLHRLSIGLPGRRLGAHTPTRCLQTSSTSQSQNSFYPLYPSVSQLLREQGIPLSDVPKIPASGPQGRLLKGDVLSYVGAIPADYSSSQSARIKSLQHLDLSNIKLAAPKPPPPEEPKAAAPLPPQPKETEVSVSVSLSPVLSTQRRIQKTLGVTIPLSTFLARATDLANDDLPRSRNTTPSADELFEQLVGAQSSVESSTTRGDFMPDINADLTDPVTESTEAKVEKADIIDILSGKPSSPRKPTGQPKAIESGITTSGDSAINVFSLTVPEGEEKRAKVFLERVKTVLQVNPGSLVL
ncbi:pyridoxine biosynthesis protein [Arachnomyces sp. PD_36]|nr:pyridoxine biosynthesis protein [Arachnomyces sp. PD_36]